MSQDTEQEIKRALAKIRQYLATPQPESFERALSARDTALIKVELLLPEARAGNAYRDRMVRMAQVRGKDQTRERAPKCAEWNAEALRLGVERPWLLTKGHRTALVRAVKKSLDLPDSVGAIWRRLKVKPLP